MTTKRYGAAPGAYGASLTISYPTGEPPTLDDMVPRLKNNRPVWADLAPRFKNDPDVYEGNRFVNDRMPVKGAKGRRPDGKGFGGGYGGRIRARLANKKISLTSNRPYVPVLTDDFIDEIADTLSTFWLDGEP
tara:strand:- start:17 stop:415 length:399 start_codon:yes stop_codon:yes gene_type:complete